MKKTGQLLREAREERGISIQEVSVHLKINNRILRALEEGDRTHLPAKTFLRGFVRSYAQFLRLNENQILDLFQAEMGTTHPNMITKQVEMAGASEPAPLEVPSGAESQEVVSTPSETPSTPEPAKINPAYSIEATLEQNKGKGPVGTLSVDQKTWSNSLKIATILVVIAIAAIILGVVKTIEKYEREAQVVQAPPIPLEAVARTEQESPTSPLATMVPSNEGGEALLTSTPVPLDAGADPNAAMTPMATPVAGDPSGVSSTGSSESAKATAPTPRPQVIIVEALDRVVVEYSIDDKPKATVVLNPEKVHTFKGEQKIQLGFSDGGSINLIHNGKDRGVPGSLGKPLKLSFPEVQ